MTWLRVLALRFSGMFAKRRRDAQLEEELQAHLEMLVEQNLQRGMPADEARRAAKLALGGAEQIKEAVRDQRGLPFLESLITDMRFALRMLRKSPGFTAVAILTLALGIGACTVVFSVYYNLLFNAFAAKDASRLAVPVIESAENAQRSGVAVEPMQCLLPSFNAVREAFEDIVCFGYVPMLLGDGREMRQLEGGYVSANAFDFYGVQPLLGRTITPGDAKSGAPRVFVMSFGTWRGEFDANPQILGKTFTVNDEPRTLIGIMPPRFQAYGALVSIWMPVDIQDASIPHNNLYTLARLKPGITLEETSANLDLIAKQLAKDQPSAFPQRFTARVQSASDFLMGPYGIGSAGGSEFGLKHMIYSLLAGALLLLLIACSNVADLLLARATVREREIAVRSALGATRGRLVRQLLTESSILAGGACLLGCVLAYFGLRSVAAIVPHKGLAVGGEVVLGLDRTVLFFTVGITVLTTLICGLAPALRAAGADIQSQLAGSGKGANGNFYHGTIRAGLVVGEVALSIVLLTGAGLAIRSFFVMTHVDMGFNPKNVFLAAFGNRHLTPEQGKALFQKSIQALKTVPGVAAVAVNNAIPGYNGGHGWHVAAPGSARSEDAGVDGCSENLPETLGLQMVSGRWLSKADVDSALYVAVINQTMARTLWGDENRVGQQLEVKLFVPKGQPAHEIYFRIVGVVRDMNNFGPEQPVLPEAFIPYTIHGGGILTIKTKVAPDSLLRPIEGRIWAIDPDVTFGAAESVEDFLDRLSYSAPKFGVMTIAPVAGIALLLVMTGIFSVMAYTVSLQTREIGIRMALGAQQGDVSRMVLRKGLGLVATGVAIGLCASFALTRFLASQIWGVSPTDPWTFSAVVAVIILVALAACYIPARCATSELPKNNLWADLRNEISIAWGNSREGRTGSKKI
jgi:putative ABC transport system permease protein